MPKPINKWQGLNKEYRNEFDDESGSEFEASDQSDTDYESDKENQDPAENVLPARRFSLRLQDCKPLYGLLPSPKKLAKGHVGGGYLGFEKNPTKRPLVAIKQNGQLLQDGELYEKCKQSKNYQSKALCTTPDKKGNIKSKLITPEKQHEMLAAYEIQAETEAFTGNFIIYVRKADLQEIQAFVDRKKQESPAAAKLLDNYYQRQIKFFTQKYATCDEENINNNDTDNNLNHLLADKVAGNCKAVGVVVSPASINAQLRKDQRRSQNQVMNYVPAWKYAKACGEEVISYHKTKNWQWGHLGAWLHNGEVVTDRKAFEELLKTGETAKENLQSTQSKANLNAITDAANLYMLQIEMTITQLAMYVLKERIGYWNTQEIVPGRHVGVKGTYLIVILLNERRYQFTINYECNILKKPYFEPQEFIFKVVNHVLSLNNIQLCVKPEKRKCEESTFENEEENNANTEFASVSRRLEFGSPAKKSLTMRL
jgi:hypothetical protein